MNFSINIDFLEHKWYYKFMKRHELSYSSLSHESQSRIKTARRVAAIALVAGTLEASTGAGAATLDTLGDATHSVGDIITQSPNFSQETVTETVTTGETIWDLADEVDDPKDNASQRQIVDYIVALNDLPSTEISAGDTITLPDHVE